MNRVILDSKGDQRLLWGTKKTSGDVLREQEGPNYDLHR